MIGELCSWRVTPLLHFCEHAPNLLMCLPACSYLTRPSVDCGKCKKPGFPVIGLHSQMRDDRVDAAICCGGAPFHKATRSARWITRASARGWRHRTALNPPTHGHSSVSLIWRRRNLSRSDRDAATWRGKLAATVLNWPITALLVVSQLECRATSRHGGAARPGQAPALRCMLGHYRVAPAIDTKKNLR
jgi:hypothetical protein